MRYSSAGSQRSIHAFMADQPSVRQDLRSERIGGKLILEWLSRSRRSVRDFLPLCCGPEPARMNRLAKTSKRGPARGSLPDVAGSDRHTGDLLPRKCVGPNGTTVTERRYVGRTARAEAPAPNLELNGMAGSQPSACSCRSRPVCCRMANSNLRPLGYESGALSSGESHKHAVPAAEVQE